MNDFSEKTLNIHRKEFDTYYFDENHTDSDLRYYEYLSFSKFWQYAFIKSDYIIDTGNFETVNRALLYRFHIKIKRHPLLWKLFRFIFAV